MAGNQNRKIPISRWWALGTGIGGYIVLFLTLIVIVSKSPDMWWFVITTLGGTLIADLITKLSERAYRNRREQWVFAIKFGFFAEAIVGGAVLGELAKSVISIGLFETQFSVAFVVFWGLNAFVPALLFIDFLVRSDFVVFSARQNRT